MPKDERSFVMGVFVSLFGRKREIFINTDDTKKKK